jgi:hypothetical protein
MASVESGTGVAALHAADAPAGAARAGTRVRRRRRTSNMAPQTTPARGPGYA